MIITECNTVPWNLMNNLNNKKKNRDCDDDTVFFGDTYRHIVNESIFFTVTELRTFSIVQGVQS